ncbi:threonine ammonia-lyase [Burkholderiales bacterium]|nr:threonine ammonia-lyase [Burkholderiales bacterium]
MNQLFKDIRQAHEDITPSIQRTQFVKSTTLSGLLSCHVFLKFENHQFTASFKERGALNRILSMSAEERANGVIAASAGNHAQGLAYHAKQHGIRSVIVMPRIAPQVKVVHTRALGAEVILYGDNFDEAHEHALSLAKKKGLIFIHPYDDDKVIAGQGTIAIEMLEDVPNLDSILVPIGGGGLISGVATAAKAINPEVKVYGVESACFNSMYAHINGVTPSFGSVTIADGIAVKEPGKLTSKIVSELVDDIFLVDEDEIEEAMLLLLEIEKTLVEGAGAIGLAALKKQAELFQDKNVGLILCGGNVDPLTLTAIIDRGMVKAGRLARLTVQITDMPGSLSTVSKIFGECNANIDEVHHQRTFTTLPIQSTEVAFSIKTRDHQHIEDIIRVLSENGYMVTDLAQQASLNKV